MARPDTSIPKWGFCRHAALLTLPIIFAACSSGPLPAPDPKLRSQALEAESDAVRRYAHADYVGALRGFIEAQRLQQSLDNPTAVARNQINQARAEMALGHTDAALQRASLVVDPVSQVEALLLQAQANLALGRVAVAHTHLTMLDRICSTECPFTGSVHVLHARAALMQKRPVEALAHAESALRILLERHEPLEIANAWRLIASAQLVLSDTSKALGAAQAALEIDRQLALPEKIARDWLLIGDIHRKANAPQQHESYQRALAVAQAARVTEVIRIATQALKENTP